jgi:hypothetical protein
MSNINLKKILFDIKKHKLSLEDIFKDMDDETTCNEIFFRNAVKLDGNVLKYASFKIRDNKEIVMSAVKESCFSLLYASDRLKYDEDVVLQSTSQRSMLYDNHLVFPEKLLKNRDFVLKLIQTNSYNIKFIPNDLRDDKLLYVSALSGDSSILDLRLKAFDDETYNKLYILLENKDFATEAILKNIHVFNYLSDDFKKNELFILNLIERLIELEQKGGYDTFKQKRDLLVSIIKINNNNKRIINASLKYTIDDIYLGELIFKNIAQDLYNNVDFILSAMAINGFLFRYIPTIFKNNKAIVLSAINNQSKTKRGQLGNDSPLQYASESLRDDMEVVLAAIQNDGKAISHVSDNLKNNVDLVFDSLKNSAGLSYFNYLPLELQNRENLLLALKNGGGLIGDIPINLRSDKEIVMFAVKDYGENLCQASTELKNDKEIVLAAVKSSGEVLENVSNELRNDPEIVLAAVSQNGAALKFASEELKNNLQITKTAVSNKHCSLSNSYLPALAYVGNIFKNDKEIILKSFEGGGNYKILENELVPAKLLNDKDFVLKLFKKDTRNFIKYYWKLLPAKIKNDLDIYTLKLIN